jgi:hypothetical protein
VVARTLRRLALGLVLGAAGAAAVSSVLPASLFGSAAAGPVTIRHLLRPIRMTSSAR